MEHKKGFITVATGSYYCRLAENLAMSYRLFSDNTYPLYVLTDQAGARRLQKTFDGVLVMEAPTYTFMDKLMVYQSSPFEETIFLDADMNIIRDISFLFDAFEQNGSAVSCIGSVRRIAEWGAPIHFGAPAVEKYNLTEYIAFGGGMYYYQRGEQTDAFFAFVFDELVPQYHQLQMKVFRENQLADEPLMGLAMLVQGMRPLDSPMDIMRYDDHMMDTLRWRIGKQSCTFIWKEGKPVDPIIVHYGTHNTRHRKYVFYNAIVRGKYRKNPVMIPFYLLYREICLLIMHLKRPQDRRAFAMWFRAHFTKAYWQNKKQKLQALLQKRK